MPKQYGPRVGGVTWTSGPYGEDEITDTDTGRPVAIVSQDWLDGVLAGAGVVQCDAGHIETRLTELRARTIELQSEVIRLNAELAGYRSRKLEMDLRDQLSREVTHSAELDRKLAAVTAERDELASSFMELHNLAKKVVGPKK